MAEAISNHLFTRRTARYYTLGNTVNPKKVWVVLHGYAYLAANFIKEFEQYGSDDTLIIAPEALSRFYAKGMGGDGAASWMTREDRLADISDNVTYLDTLYSEVIEPLGDVELNGLGFSQGVATLTRWAVMGVARFNQLIFWAGDIPNDVNPESFANLSTQTKLTLVYGTEDTLIPTGYVDQLQAMMDSWGVTFERKTFVGKHEMNQQLLAEII